MPSSAAAARAAASDTPRIAFAPRRPLFGVPSSSIMARSRPCWSSASIPATAAAISPFTLSTARPTPLPFHASPPSRSSTASNSPVEAPEGTAARPAAPERSATSTSTVGLPRLSTISLAPTRSISPTERPILADLRLPTPGRGTQRQLGINPRVGGELDEREQRVARRGLELVAGPPVGEPPRARAERAQDLVGHGRRAQALSASDRLPRVQKRREVLGQVGEGIAVPTALARALDLVPVLADLRRRRRFGLAEHVRVAADELLAASLGDRGKRAGTTLLEQEGEEVDLEEHVAELVEQLRVVARGGGVGELVGLLDGVRDNRALVLLTIPGALPAQPSGHLVELGDRSGGLGGAVGALGRRAHPPGAPPPGAAPPPVGGAPPCGAPWPPAPGTPGC